LQVLLVQLGKVDQQALVVLQDYKEFPELRQHRAAQVLLVLKVQPDHRELLVKVLQVLPVQLVRLVQPVSLVMTVLQVLLVLEEQQVLRALLEQQGK
jgi:hypothetical protein